MNYPTHTKFFQIAGMSIEVKTDLPITDQTFDVKFNAFETNAPLEENIVLSHRFSYDP